MIWPISIIQLSNSLATAASYKPTRESQICRMVVNQTGRLCDRRYVFVPFTRRVSKCGSMVSRVTVLSKECNRRKSGK